MIRFGNSTPYIALSDPEKLQCGSCPSQEVEPTQAVLLFNVAQLSEDCKSTCASLCISLSLSFYLYIYIYLSIKLSFYIYIYTAFPPRRNQSAKGGLLILGTSSTRERRRCGELGQMAPTKKNGSIAPLSFLMTVDFCYARKNPKLRPTHFALLYMFSHAGLC